MGFAMFFPPMRPPKIDSDSWFDQQAQPGTFDFITTFDAVHDEVSPRNVLRGSRISLANDGVYLAQDIKASSDVQDNREHPLDPLLYRISCSRGLATGLQKERDSAFIPGRRAKRPGSYRSGRSPAPDAAACSMSRDRLSRVIPQVIQDRILSTTIQTSTVGQIPPRFR
jgi:hypothetical protein